MQSILVAYATVRQDREGDEAYHYWDLSVIKHLRINKVPLTLQDEKKKTALVYSKWGLKNFKPWYVSPLNSGKNDDFVFLMLNLLKKTNNCLTNERYWYFRGD